MPGDIATCCNSSMKYSSSGTDCTTLSNVNPVSKTELTPSADESETSIGCSRGQVKSGGGSITADDEIEHITDEPISDEDVAECSDDAEYDTDLEIKEEVEESEPHAGIGVYKRVCYQTTTAQQQAIIRGLRSSELNVAHRALGAVAIKPLAAALTKNTLVERLDLTDNIIGSEGAVYIANLLKKNEFITDLNLTSNDIGARGAEAIGIMLAGNKGLRRLNLSGNKFSDEKSAASIGDGILCNCRLVHLDLSHNDMNERGAAFLGLAFRENLSIETLNVSWNKLRQKGTVSLCIGLQMNTVLTRLDLSWNGLSYGGSLALRELLKSNERLQEIDASNNDINWEGALLISEGLQLNQTLQVLRLGHNALTTTGCMDLVEAASKSALVVLDLTSVPVIAEFDLMAVAIRHTRPFERIHGGIVNSHDVLGQRRGRRAPAMQLVIDYMKMNSIRTTELMRSFDKRAANNIKKQEFVRRIRQSGIEMQKYEMKELLNHIGREKHDDSNQNINYQVMANSVNAHIKQERVVKMKEQLKLERQETYHASILNDNLPPIAGKATPEDQKMSLLNQSLRHHRRQEKTKSEIGHVSATNLHRLHTELLVPLNQEQTKILSMSTALGSKAVKFGAGEMKKKKKKKKRQKTAKTKNK